MPTVGLCLKVHGNSIGACACAAHRQSYHPVEFAEVLAVGRVHPEDQAEGLCVVERVRGQI